MRILNFGSCNIDHVYKMHHIVSPGETEASAKLETFPGGKGLNQSIALARAGAKVCHAGLVGGDGEWLKALLSENGVDVSCLETAEDRKTGHAVIQVAESGENSIILYGGCNREITKELADRVLENFGEGDILLLQNEISNLKYIVDKGYEKGMKIILNPAPFTEELKEIDLKKLFCLIPNEVEAEALAGADTPENNVKKLQSLCDGLRVLITVGKKGSIYFDGEKLIKQPAFKVDAVDTTAAGDTFIGYFVASLSNGEDVAKALDIASCASAIAVSRMGAAVSVPYMSEVKENIGKMKRVNI